MLGGIKMKRSIMIGGVIAMGLAMSFNFTAEAKTARTKTVKAEKTVKTKTVKAEKKEDKKENKKSKTTKKMVFQDEEGKTIKSATMYRSEKHTFELKHVDEETLKEITWRSSDRQIAKVSKKGVVTAKKLGKCYIIATNPETKKYTKIRIKVRKKRVIKRIKIETEKKVCEPGDTLTLSYVTVPKKADIKGVVWKSSKPKIAEIDENGQVKALKPGKTSITVRATGTKVKKKITIKVNPVAVTKVESSDEKVGLKLEHGAKKAVHYQVDPINATVKEVTFSSKDNSIASVDAKGNVTAGRPGKTKVVIKSKNGGKRVEVPVEVTAKNGLLTKAMLDKFDLTSIDNLMIVAHPDDETLWGGGHLASDDYFVLCLTNGWNGIRSRDYYRALGAFNDKGIILSYPDLVDGKRSDWSNAKEGIMKDLQLILNYKKWNKVVTHNPEGEYGHVHHKMTSSFTTQMWDKLAPKTGQLWYFGRFYEKQNIGQVKDEATLETDLLNKKKVGLSYYSNQQKLINLFNQMHPYELWKTREEWDQTMNDNGKDSNKELNHATTEKR